MLSTHLAMDEDLKDTFKSIDEHLTRNQTAMNSESFFSNKAKTQESYLECRQHITTHYACINVMNSLNEFSWLILNNDLSFYHMQQVKLLATAVNSYLKNINDKSAREIILRIKHLNNSLKQSEDYTSFNATLSALWDIFGFVCSITTVVIGLALVAGIATIGFSLLPTIAIGIGLSILGFSSSMMTLESAETHSRLAFGSQMQELDDFAKALTSRHNLESILSSEATTEDRTFTLSPLTTI